VAERWRSERWDSLRLLTPNWQSRLPGFRYDGPDPDGYMTKGEVVGYLERYAASFAPPLETGTAVRRVTASGGGYRVETDRGGWTCASVVVATGYCDQPLVPPAAAGLHAGILQVVPGRYRNPGQLPEGGVLVVGASATGVQLADEIRRSGRPVTLSAGHHTRLPRIYRGRDILWWLDRMGVFDETTDDVFDPTTSRRQPSLQLVGSPDRRSIDLASLRRRGVRIAGRLLSADGVRVRFDDDLVATTAASDAKLAALLARVDAFAASGRAGRVDAVEPFVPQWPDAMRDPGPAGIDLAAEGVAAVVWATGFRRSYAWLRVPVLDARGEIRHEGGVTPSPGLYVLGLHFQRRRNSAFIDGVGADAAAVADHLVARLTRAAAGRRKRAS
jgi:putative flavoprotein involved in K+ transport